MFILTLRGALLQNDPENQPQLELDAVCDLLKTLAENFSSDFYDHIGVVITEWGSDQKS